MTRSVSALMSSLMKNMELGDVGSCVGSASVKPSPTKKAKATVCEEVSAGDIFPDDSASQVSGDASDLGEKDVKLNKASSKQKLAILKSRLPLLPIIMGEKLGREEAGVRKYMAPGKLDNADSKALRNYLRQVR